MQQRIFLSLTFCFLGICVLFGQNPDSDKLYTKPQLDSSIAVGAAWSIGLDFDSRALVAGRDFDLAQQAFMPSFSYIHPSGCYAAASGSFLSAAEPQYSQTTLGLGYGRELGKSAYLSLSYDHFFFHPADEGLLKNSLSAYGSLSKGMFNLGASYTALFDPETAHQINVSSSLNLQKVLDWLHTRVFFSPNLSLMAGTETVPLQRFSNQLIAKGTGRRWEERSRLPGPAVIPKNEAEQTTFSPLSMTLSLPLSMQMKCVNVSFTVNYVVPFTTASEPQKPDNSLYFSTGLNWVLK